VLIAIVEVFAATAVQKTQIAACEILAGKHEGNVSKGVDRVFYLCIMRTSSLTQRLLFKSNEQTID